jgi:hypothetical protein
MAALRPDPLDTGAGDATSSAAAQAAPRPGRYEIDTSCSAVTFRTRHLLGPNGAGKTTTLEIMEGFRTADAGRVEVLGYDRATGPAGGRCANGSGWCCRTSRSSRT